MKSKTIILSSQKKFINNSPRAILTFISNNKTVEGKLRLYNLPSLPPASKLGIYYESQVYTANLIKKDGAFSFYLDENFNLDNNIYCAIIDKGNNNDVVLCGGTSNNFIYSIENEEDNEFENVINENINKSEDNIKQVEKKPVKPYNECNDCANCENCVYKEYFYSHHKKSEDQEQNHEEENKDILELNPNESIEEVKENNKNLEFYSNNDNKNFEEVKYPNNNCKNIEEIKENKDNLEFYLNNNNISIDDKDNEVDVKVSDLDYENEKNNEVVDNDEINTLNKDSENDTVNTLNKESEKFLESITEQLDDMFKTYPEDDTIMKIIPNSKVIKVTDTIDQSSYIVGVIYENGEIKYLLYGVPCKYNEPVPKELGENYQWLPLNTDDPMSDGYYLLYQDASSGKIVPIIVE